MNADLTTKAEAARELGVEPYVIHVLAHSEGIPTFRHPLNGNAHCFNRAGMKRLRKLAATYKRNKQAALVSA